MCFLGAKRFFFSHFIQFFARLVDFQQSFQLLMSILTGSNHDLSMTLGGNRHVSHLWHDLDPCLRRHATQRAASLRR